MRSLKGTGAAALGAALVALVLAGLLSGCGGGGGSANGGTVPGPGAPRATGRVTLTIRWPEAARLIPARAQSLRVFLHQGDPGSPTPGTLRDLNSPGFGGTSTYGPVDVVVGSYVIRAEAYPDPGAGGVMQAVAEVPVTVTAGQTSDTTVTLNSTIQRLEVSGGRLTGGPNGPFALLLPAANVPGGPADTETLTVTARDAQNNVVLVTPDKIAWSVSPGGKATVTQNTPANVNGQSAVVDASQSTYAGRTSTPVTLTVAETESGVSATVALSVHPVVTLAINSNDATVEQDDTRTVTATVTGANAAPSVAFSVTGTPPATLEGTTATQTTFRAPRTGADVNTAYTVTAISDEGPDTLSLASFGLTVPPIVVTVTPNPATVKQGEAVTFTATITGARDKTANWTVAGTPAPSPASANGTATFVFNGPLTDAAGDTAYTITARSAFDTTKLGTASVTVPPIVVTINQTDQTLNAGQQFTFSATVTGAQNAAVTWGVDGGAANGTISAVGVYTAPNRAGTFTVRATSVADPTAPPASVTATRQVTVQTGGVSTVIN